MASATTSYVIVAISVFALLVFLSALRKVLRQGEWSKTATLAAVIAASTTTSVELVITYLGRWQEVTDLSNTMPFILPAEGHLAWRALSLALGVLAAVVFLVQAKRRDVPINTPAVLIAMLPLISFGSSLLQGDNPFRPSSVVFAILLIACSVAPRGLGIHLGIATCATIVALASGFTFLSFIAENGISVFACKPDKCGILGFNFSGVTGNENGFAMYLALAMPFVFIGFGSWEGVTLCAYMLGLIMMSGSRSGALAGLITFVFLILLRPNIRRPVVTPIRSRLLYLGLAAAFIVGMVIPFLTHEATAYTGRGYIWSSALQVLSDPAALWYGTGELGLEHMLEAGTIQYVVYSVHNQWLQVLFATGLIGFVLFVAALALMLWNARGAYTLVVGSVLLPVFVLSVTERPWPIDTVDWAAWVIPAALLSYPAIRGGGEPSEAKPILSANKRPGGAVAVGSGS